MSDYKVVASDISITDKVCLIKALEEIFGSVQENAMAEQVRWPQHNRVIDIVIKRAQLPADLQDFGDVGFQLGADGKYQYVTCAANDSGYFDPAKQAELVRNGTSPADAQKAYPPGKFAADLLNHLKQVEIPYEVFSFAADIKKKCPGATFSEVGGEATDAMAWMMRGSVSASDLAKLGITVPA